MPDLDDSLELQFEVGNQSTRRTKRVKKAKIQTFKPSASAPAPRRGGPSANTDLNDSAFDDNDNVVHVQIEPEDVRRTYTSATSVCTVSFIYIANIVLKTYP